MSTREPADLLIEPRWLLPVAPLNTVLEHHAVAISAGRIAAVGPAGQLRARFEARERLVRAQHALLPGLVNADTRACHALLRSVPVAGPRQRWLAEQLAPLEQRVMSADFVRDGTRLAAAEMLRAGITCFADLSPFPEEAARAAAPLRAAVGLPVGDLPTPWAESATAHLERAEALWDQYRADPRVTLYFAPLPHPHLSDATLARVRRVADELEARIALHLADLPAAPLDGPPGVADAAAPAPYGARTLPRLAAQGLLRPGFTAIGAGALRHEELELLARHGATLVCCPQAQLRLGAAPGPLPLLGADRTGLGTDSAAIGALDVLAETRLAALLCGLTGLEALRLATLGGATALGLAAHIGSIEPGKAADLACLDLGGGGAGLVADAIVFSATRSAVSDVWCAGRAALSAGQLRAFDAEELAALPQRWAQRLGAEAAA